MQYIIIPKAKVMSIMYDMRRIDAKGYSDSVNSKEKNMKIKSY